VNVVNNPGFEIVITLNCTDSSDDGLGIPIASLQAGLKNNNSSRQAAQKNKLP